MMESLEQAENRAAFKIGQLAVRLELPGPWRKPVHIYSAKLDTRMVYGIIDPDFRDPRRVIKIAGRRKLGEDEFTKMGAICDIWGLADTRKVLPPAFEVLNMPWAGEDMVEMAIPLNMARIGYPDETEAFTGFSRKHCQWLVDGLLTKCRQLESKYGYVHKDIYHLNGPNNVVYASEADTSGQDALRLIDAEALIPATQLARQDFEVQFFQLSEWICRNLASIEPFR